MVHIPIKLRVFTRDEAATIIVWNTNNLTADQRRQPNINVQIEGSSSWFSPSVTTPDIRTMPQAIDGPTDVRAIQHMGALNENVGFNLRISFGANVDFETEMSVKPKGQHSGHVRVQRVKKESGKAVYANPAWVVGLDDETWSKLAFIIRNEVQKALR